jgi:hypothetical protein
MKNTKYFFLGGVLVLIAFLVMAATIDYRALNTNQFTSSGTVTIKSGAPLTNGVFTGNTRIGTGNIITNAVFVGPMVGDASGLTNIAQVVNNITFESNVVIQQTLTVNQAAFFNSNVTISGKAVFNQSVHITKLESSTNAAPTGVIDFSKNGFLLRTNNNVSFAEAVNWSTTNRNETIISFTNSGATPKTAFTITMHGTYQNMKAEEGQTLYCTNVGQLLVWGEQGQTGTNFYWRSR